MLGGVLVMWRDFASSNVEEMLLRGCVLAVVATAAVLLQTRQRWRLRELRVVEAVVFLTLTLYLAGTTYTVGVTNLDAMIAGWTSTLFGFGLLMIAYGVFVLNTLRRAAVGVVSIGAASLGSTLLVRVSEPATQGAFDTAAIGRLFETGIVLGSHGLVAVVASFVIFTLFNYAFDQRKRSFYDLEERIGSGGMGEVWRGRHQTLARPTAIKLIREDRIAGVDTETARRVLRRFEREAKATAALRSPHTIEVYDFGVTSDGHFYYAMELLEGLDLQALVDQFGPLPPERVVHLLLQACDSLADAHEHGMTHRDIKPANLFLSRLGPSADHLKVLDFGLVQEVQEVQAQSCEPSPEGTVVGTLAYLAPEMILEPAEINGRSDIYALGCVAYWLCTGTLVFQTDSAREQIDAHINTLPALLSTRTDLPVPPALEAIIMKCLEKKPGDRFDGAAALAAALREVPLPAPWDTRRAHAWWASWMPPSAAVALSPAMVRTTIDRQVAQAGDTT